MTFQKGKLNPRYGMKGKRRIVKSGYICLYIPKHPNSTSLGYIPEHRLIMEKKIGRYLKSGELVHHIDGNRSNNKLENLKIITKSEHMKLHSKEKKRNKNGEFTKDE